MGIAEPEPDVFIVSLSDLYSTHESHLARVDLNGWTPGKPVTPEIALTFDDRVRGQVLVNHRGAGTTSENSAWRLPQLAARPGPRWLVAGLAACRDEERM
jgi:hypothetical protein